MAEHSFKVDGGIEAVGIITCSAFKRVGGSSTEFLMADGSVDNRTFSTTDTNTTYDISAADHTSNKKLIRLNDGSTNKDVVIAGGTNVVVSRTNDEISIASSETTYDISAVDGSGSNKTIRLTGTGPGAGTTEVTFVPGSNVSLGRNNNEITINSTTYSVQDGEFSEKNFTTALKTKLDGVAAGANVNVNTDWTATSGISSILNKPTNVSTWTNDSGYLTTESDTLATVTSRGSVTTNDIGIRNLSAGIGTFTGNLQVNGNLQVDGTQTTINTATLNIADNEITLNSDVTGNPTSNAGIEVERGTGTNTKIRWNESNDKWEFTNDGSAYNNLASYSVSAADGGTAQKKLIRLSDSNGVNDDVTLVAGNGITLARSNDEITITNNAPDTDTTYSQSCVDSSNDVILRLTDSSSTNDDIKVKAGSNITLTHDNANQFTITAASVSGVPTGLISIWSGASSSIPSGWTLCNGSNGTPDLRNRFVLGAGDTYAVDATGGNESVTLSTSQMPSHTHGDGNYATSNTGNHSHGDGNYGTNNTGNHSHNLSGNTNNTGAHTHGILYADSDSQNTPSTNLRVWNQVQNPSTYSTTSSGGHSHNISGNTSNTGAHSHNVTGNSGNTGAHSHNVTGSSGSTGGGSSFDNRPPYYALCYIMKT